jgi:integrase
MAAVDQTPRYPRRALTPDEIARLLAVAPPERALVYRVALASGLRAGELAALTAGDVDAERGGLILHAEWTKNRQGGFQPLPASLVAALGATMTGDPSAPLLSFTRHHAARRLALDLAAAGIERHTGAGKVDFHSLRVTYVTLLCESSANVREVQALARHASPALTMGTYARVRDAGLRAAVERIGAVLPDSCAPGAHDCLPRKCSDCGS